MNFEFFDNLNPQLSPAEALKSLNWSIQKYNALFLAGKGTEASRELQPMPFQPPPDIEITTEDQEKIIGDINDALPLNASIIVATTSFFKLAIDRAQRLGYRPARAGEFLQLMKFLEGTQRFFGYFFCWEGRTPGYAILATNHRQSSSWVLKFDTQIDGLNYVSANADCNCFFVKDETTHPE